MHRAFAINKAIANSAISRTPPRSAIIRVYRAAAVFTSSAALGRDRCSKARLSWIHLRRSLTMTITRMTRTATPINNPAIHIGHIVMTVSLMTILAPVLPDGCSRGAKRVLLPTDSPGPLEFRGGCGPFALRTTGTGLQSDHGRTHHGQTRQRGWRQRGDDSVLTQLSQLEGSQGVSLSESVKATQRSSPQRRGSATYSDGI